MSEAIKAFQTLHSNSEISLIILKGNLSYVLKKMHVYVYKVSYCDKGEMKDSKNFVVA